MSKQIDKKTDYAVGNDEQLMKKWVLQSTSDDAFFGMTEEEFNQRANRLAFKELNGIIDEEVIASKERHYRNMITLYGKNEADKMRRKYTKLGIW